MGTGQGRGLKDRAEPKRIILQALKSNEVYPGGLWTSLGSVTPFPILISPY